MIENLRKTLENPRKWRLALLGVLLLGWAFSAFVAHFQFAPGYMDADYYYAVGARLASGDGFTEPFLWNYLDEPRSLPHPSNAYWMPLASIWAAAMIKLNAAEHFAAARRGFVFLAGFLPPLTAVLAVRLHGRRDWALYSALLAAFSGFYASVFPTTDTFSLYMLSGTLFLLAAGANRKWTPWALGALAGFMHLTRADGILWLPLAWLALLLRRDETRFRCRDCLVAAAAYGLVMLPWFWRNWRVFGSLFAPGGYRALLLTSYNQTFSFPASLITWQTFLQSGFAEILRVRLWALGMNLATFFAVQGGIFWLPFILWGAWRLREQAIVRLGALSWLTIFLAMTLAFPFAGARGGFFHSGSALQPLMWALSPVGLSAAVRWARARGRFDENARWLLPSLFLLMTISLTAVLVWSRVITQPWQGNQPLYAQTEAVLDSLADENAPVIVANPPGYWLASGRPALALPDGGVDAILRLADVFHARYVLLEDGACPDDLDSFYRAPGTSAALRYLTTIKDARLYEIITP